MQNCASKKAVIQTTDRAGRRIHPKRCRYVGEHPGVLLMVEVDYKIMFYDEDAPLAASHV